MKDIAVMQNKINIQNSDNLINILETFNTIMTSEKSNIINEWTDSENINDVLQTLSISTEQFKDEYANGIYTFFLTYTMKNTNNCVCPTAEKLLLDNIAKTEIIHSLVLICNKFKEILFNKLIASNLENKILIYNQFNTIFNNNLSILIATYSKYIATLKNNYEHRLHLIEDNSLISKSDKFGKITFVSTPLCKALGYTKDQLIGKKYNILRHPDVPSRVYEEMWEKLKAGKSWNGRLKNYTESKEEIIFNTTIIPEVDNNKNIIGYIAIKTDLTAKINNGIDKLTGIMNRAGFDETFEKMTKVKTNNTSTVVMIDIDYFKNVNDVYGHIVGDEVLKKFVEVINNEIRPSDIFARWGGEEFVIILNDIKIKTALVIVERIRKAIENTIFDEVGSKTASFGVASYKAGCCSILDFMKYIDAALYFSKHNGRNKISYFDEIDSDYKIYVSKDIN
jgi:diguanylate cyclase (GGDEF)-like protein/PAS domain S-box-containing protein